MDPISGGALKSYKLGSKPPPATIMVIKVLSPASFSKPSTPLAAYPPPHGEDEKALLFLDVGAIPILGARDRVSSEKPLEQELNRPEIWLISKKESGPQCHTGCYLPGAISKACKSSLPSICPLFRSLNLSLG